jgi:ribose 5-phosphate isomerase B
MIYLGSDHAGFKLKQQIKTYLDKTKAPYEDLGNLKLQSDDDYPDYGYEVAKAVAENKNSKGILICGSSYGVCIVANKVKNIRAVSVFTSQEAKLSREHNNANVLCLSGWDLSPSKTKQIIKIWLNTKFSPAKRHQRRVKKIQNIENKELK